MKKTKIRKFSLTSKKSVNLRYYDSSYYGSFVASSRMMGPIKIGEYFDKLPSDEQKAIIWHELYHQKSLTRLLGICLEVICFFTKENLGWIEEFDADRYSANNCGKEKTLKFLKKAGELYKKRIVEYNSKTHPPIEERIKRVEELK